MLHFLELGELEIRAKAIGSNLSELGAAAGLHPTSVYRASREGRNMRSMNSVALTQALIRKERALLAHLIALHPELVGEEAATRAAAWSAPAQGLPLFEGAAE